MLRTLPGRGGRSVLHSLRVIFSRGIPDRSEQPGHLGDARRSKAYANQSLTKRRMPRARDSIFAGEPIGDPGHDKNSGIER